MCFVMRCTRFVSYLTTMSDFWCGFAAVRCANSLAGT
uniref:Uncharacterized protein n=1 Tax=Anguilla anguilla TaxID=7936 RepID=A0A0E9VZM0_ANGAN